MDFWFFYVFEYTLSAFQFFLICAFANSVYPNSKNIFTSMNETTGHDGVFIITHSDVERYYEHFNPVILKYDRKTDVGGMASFNYGECKGMTFDRVLLYPTKLLVAFLSGEQLKTQEKSYVAVTRPKYSLAIVVDKLPASTAFEPATISCANGNIHALRFMDALGKPIPS